MKVLIVAPGSMGDVAPFTGLSARLREDGHEVSVATHRRFQGIITGAGLEFRALRGDPEQLGATEQGQRWQKAGTGPMGMIRFGRLLIAYMQDLCEDIVAAARQGADVMLLNVFGVLIGYHVAEALGIPSAGLFMAPIQPTGEFPAPGIPIPNLGTWSNRTIGQMVLAAGSASFGRTTKGLREQLGLPPMRVSSLWRHLDTQRWPAFYGFSETVVSRPADWREGIEVTGYWWPVTLPTWRPPDELETFLDGGPPPVYVGLGSRNFDDPTRIETIVREALRQAGLRGVVQSGWAGLSVTDDDIITVGEAPHEWLFPRMAAVAHHCGAGTTAAGLRAGVPTVGLPMIVDQPFWADRLTTLGASPGAIPMKRLTADRLAGTLRSAVVDVRYRQRAEELATTVRVEDGAGHIAVFLERLG